MKKILLGLSIGILFTGISAFALSPDIFSDSRFFPDWASDSIYKLESRGIVQGYEDGTFRANNTVTRAELAVILDRFESKLNNQNNSSSLSKEEFEYRIQKVLENLSDLENISIIPADLKNYVVMAEAGLKKLNNQPENFSNFDQIKTIDLPAGTYTVYEFTHIIVDTYLHYEGERLQGDVVDQVDEWYGPF